MIGAVYPLYFPTFLKRSFKRLCGHLRRHSSIILFPSIFCLCIFFIEHNFTKLDMTLQIFHRLFQPIFLMRIESSKGSKHHDHSPSAKPGSRMPVREPKLKVRPCRRCENDVIICAPCPFVEKTAGPSRGGPGACKEIVPVLKLVLGSLSCLVGSQAMPQGAELTGAETSCRSAGDTTRPI
jgi:hypothetical protein